MCIFRKKFNPDLIDLHDYEATLLLERDKGMPSLPPPSIPDMAFSCEELQAMKKNRRLAAEIYKRITRGKH